MMFLVLGLFLLRVYMYVHMYVYIYIYICCNSIESGSASRPLDLQCSHHCLRKGWTLAAVNCVIVKDAEGGARGRRCSIQCSDQQLCHIGRMAASIRMSGSNASWPRIMERVQTHFFSLNLFFVFAFLQFCTPELLLCIFPTEDAMGCQTHGICDIFCRRGRPNATLKSCLTWKKNCEYLAKNRDFQLTLMQVWRIGLHWLKFQVDTTSSHPFDGRSLPPVDRQFIYFFQLFLYNMPGGDGRISESWNHILRVTYPFSHLFVWLHIIQWIFCWKKTSHLKPRHRQQLQGDTVLANSVLNALAQIQRWQQAMSFMGKEVAEMATEHGETGAMAMYRVSGGYM